MNGKSPRADEVEALAVGLKLDSIFAVASRYSKLVPVVLAACLIAPAIPTCDGATPAVAVAFEVSTDICWCPAPRETTAEHFERPIALMPPHTAAFMVNGGLMTSNPSVVIPGHASFAWTSDVQLQI